MAWYSNIVGRAVYYQLRNLCSGRIYPVVGAQDAELPYVVYSTVSTTPDHTKQSASVADKVRIQVDIIDKTYDGANVIASLVRDQLDFQIGTIAGVPVDSIRFDDESTIYENEVRLHRISQDYIFRIPNDSTPSSMQSIQTVTGVAADYKATDIIPPGYAISMIIFDNPGNNVAQISAGTSAGGNNIFSSEAIDKGLTTITPKNKTFSLTQFTSVYFNHAQDGDSWNSATSTIYICLTKVK